jgi:hypothetical protein
MQYAVFYFSHARCMSYGRKKFKSLWFSYVPWVTWLAFLPPYYVGNTHVNECKPQELFTIELQRTSLLIISLPINTLFLRRCGPTLVMACLFLRLLDHTQRCTTVVRTPMDEWSVRRPDHKLTTQNTNNKHPCPRGDSNPQSQQASGPRPTP